MLEYHADDAVKKLASFRLPEDVGAVFEELRAAVICLDQEKTACILDGIRRD